MIENLAQILPDFSEVNHTWCFLHIVNLCAKSIIKQFDVVKKKEDEHLGEAACELQELAGDSELEEQQTIETVNGEGGDESDKDMDDDVDGWIDEMVALSPAEHEGLEESIHPVKLVLVKVCYQINLINLESKTYLFIAVENHIQDYQLLNYCLPHLVQTPHRTEDVQSDHALWCHNSVELDLRYAEFCTWILKGNWCFDGW